MDSNVFFVQHRFIAEHGRIQKVSLAYQNELYNDKKKNTVQSPGSRGHTDIEEKSLSSLQSGSLIRSHLT